MILTDSKGRRVEIAIQLLTAISVVVGVFLVVLELKQTRENTFNEIIQTRMDTVIQETSLIYGENLADVLAKACHQPMTLNETESLILHNFFTVQIYRHESAVLRRITSDALRNRMANLRSPIHFPNSLLPWWTILAVRPSNIS